MITRRACSTACSERLVYVADSRKTYAVFIVGDSYLPGVLALKRSLDEVGSSYPLTALTLGCSEKALADITGAGIECLGVEAPFTPPPVRALNVSVGRPRWNQTFAKLAVLGMTQFDTIVMLDADMMVVDNIDDLFDAPGMSAVVAGKGMVPDWVDLNSGLMVIKPSAELYSAAELILGDLDEKTLARYKQGIGDQDIFQILLKDWSAKDELHLSERYNLFQYCIACYDASGFLPFSTAAVVHFDLAPKPWAYGAAEWLKVLRRAVHYLSLSEIKAIRKYQRYLR